MKYKIKLFKKGGYKNAYEREFTSSATRPENAAIAGMKLSGENLYKVANYSVGYYVLLHDDKAVCCGSFFTDVFAGRVECNHNILKNNAPEYFAVNIAEQTPNP